MTNQETTHSTTHPKPLTPIQQLIAIWGILGITLFLGQAVWRLSQHAYEPIRQDMMTPFLWAAYIVWGILNAYMEGYRGFQLRYCPRVVERAIQLGRNPRPLWVILAPFYCMGLFAAPKRRMIVSWTLIVCITALVMVVRQMSQPWRGLVDIGVVIGLGWGVISLLILFVKRLIESSAPASHQTANLPESA